MEIFMIHLCTIATLMFLQNNTSQKILFIAARTIQFPGVVFKVCIYLIVAIVTSSIYFDVKSTHTYRKYIYQQSSFIDHGPKLRVLLLAIGEWPEIAKIQDKPRKMTPTSETENLFRWNVFLFFLYW